MQHVLLSLTLLGLGTIIPGLIGTGLALAGLGCGLTAVVIGLSNVCKKV